MKLIVQFLDYQIVLVDMPLLRNYGRPLLTEEREQFKKLALAGVPYRTIAKVLKVSPAAVYKWRQEYCIPNRESTKRYELRINNLRIKIGKLQVELAALEELQRRETNTVHQVVPSVEGTK